MYLVILTVQDYKNFMNIDDRFNYFMTGVSVSLISHYRKPLLYMLALIAALITINLLMKKVKAWGEGDINTLSWVFLGLGIINWQFIAYFFIVFAAVAGIYYALKYGLFRYKEATQFYPVILITFIIVSFTLSLYTNMV